MLNLIEVIRTLKIKIEELEEKKIVEVDRLIEKYDREIEKYKKALEVNLELNEACMHCGGKGKIGMTDAAGDVEHVPCKYCNGSGKAIS